jgi:hypothetical protein
MARPGLEPGTPRFSVVGQPALTSSAERSKKWLFAGVFETPSAVAAGRAVHRDTCGYVLIPVGLCRDAGVGGTNPHEAREHAMVGASRLLFRPRNRYGHSQASGGWEAARGGILDADPRHERRRD